MLTPYLKPQAVNGGMMASSKLNHAIYGSGDTLDKRNVMDSGGAFGTFANAVQTIDAAKDVAETIANTVGIRSPYFVIGEVPKNADNPYHYIWSSYDKPGVGIIRAVSNSIRRWGYEQEGVIIDCLGDINVTASVEFTTKPLVYVANTVIDSRIRKPIQIRATVAISNYLADDAVGQTLNQVAAWDPTGASDWTRNELLYGGMTRAQYALGKLRYLMENGKPFTVYTPHGYYENMLIQSLSPKTDESNMDMLLCDIVYQEAILAAPYINAKYADDAEKAFAERSPTRTSIEDNRMISIKNWLRG